MTKVTWSRGDIIEVEWFDSERVNLGWAEVDEYLKALADRAVYRTAGFFLSQDDEHMLICLNMSDRGLVGEAMVIPRALITAVTRHGRESIVRREPPPRRVTDDTVQHLVEGGASADLVDYARKRIDQ